MSLSASTVDLIRQTTKSERYLFGVLCFFNIINYMDRIGIAAVLVKIGEYLSIGDDLIGLLQTGLLIAYTLTAPAFGYLGDRYSRKFILIGCVILWSANTIIGAFCKNYMVLLLSRVFVGIGQSGFTTISPTVISDVVLRGARTVFLACFYLGIPLGGGLGYVAVSAVTKLTDNWSYGLCVGPCFCFIGIVLISFASFPKRGEKEAAEVGTIPPDSTSYKRDILYLLSVPSFDLITLAFTQICFYVGALSWWSPKCLYHGFQLIPNGSNVDLSSVAFMFGTVTVVTGVAGVVTGVILSRLLRSRFPNVDPMICSVSMIVAVPFVTMALSSIAVSQKLTYSLIFFSELCMNLNWALVTDMLLYIVIPTRRTSAHGLSMLFSHGFGDCISPYIVGLMSEYLKRNYEFTSGSFFLPIVSKKVNDPHSNIQSFHSLQMSLFIVAVVLFIGALCFFAVGFYIKRDVEKVERILAAGAVIK